MQCQALLEIVACVYNCMHHNRDDSLKSPFITWLSQRAQSGRRISFKRQMGFIESHRVLVIFFVLVYLLIHLLI